MCIFCAAVPATLAVGVSLKAKQARDLREAQVRDETLPKEKEIPVMKITLTVAGALVVASVVYHSQLSG